MPEKDYSAPCDEDNCADATVEDLRTELHYSLEHQDEGWDLAAERTKERDDALAMVEKLINAVNAMTGLLSTNYALTYCPMDLLDRISNARDDALNP